MKKILIIFLALFLFGAGCKKTDGGGTDLLSGVEWPEMCTGEELPQGFPKEMINSNSIVIEASSLGTGLEDRTTGEEYTQDGWLASFCTQLSKEEILDWYDKTLKDMGFSKEGVFDGEHIFIKDKTSINVTAYDLGEDFAIHSFNMMTANYDTQNYPAQ